MDDCEEALLVGVILFGPVHLKIVSYPKLKLSPFERNFRWSASPFLHFLDFAWLRWGSYKLIWDELHLLELVNEVNVPLVLP